MEKGLKNAYALIIGISKYKDDNITKLDYTKADAEAFFKLMTDPKKIGIKEENVKILLDENATQLKIKEAIIKWLIKEADERSTVFIFFAGHGGWETDPFKPNNKASYLLPYDTDRESFYLSALSNRDLDDWLKMIRSKKLIVLLDACHSGGVASGAREVKSFEDPYKKLAEGEGRVVISASKPEQLSYEGSSLGHGVFTYHLLDALSGKADADKNGYVTVFEVFDYLQKNVPKSARDLPKGGEQEPMIRNENLAMNFSISINPDLIELKENEKIQEDKIRKLREYFNKGKFSAKQYERLRTIVRTGNEKLPENDSNIRKLTDSFLAGDLSFETLVDELRYIEPPLFTGQKEGISVERDANQNEEGIKTSEKALHKEEMKKKQVDELTIEARLLFKKEDYSGAIEKWTDILDIDPGNKIAKDGMEKAKEKNEEDEKEKKILRLLKDAQRMSIEGNHVLAIPKWREIVEIEPENRKAKEGLRESERILREISDLNIYAQRLYDERMYDRALEKWNEVLKIDINNKIALEGVENLKNLKRVKKYCTACGQANIRGLKFCTKCGANLID